MNEVEKKKKETEKLNKVIHSLQKVPQETHLMVFNLANALSELQIIQSFNQSANDMFNTVLQITIELGKEKEYNVSGYKNLFDMALKHNIKLPIDKFTLIILEFAPQIYAKDENCFLTMTIPDKNVNVGNEFGLIRSEMFKKLWVVINSKQKAELVDKIILLTTYAHTYLYKSGISKI